MRLTLSVILLWCIIALPAHAQQLGGSQALDLQIVPQNPRPYDTITVTPTSNLIDLATARITVTVNGKVVESGGVQKVPITVGGPGEATAIVVQAVVDGSTYRAQATLRPADVALILDPVSTVHPLYRGAPLIAAQSRVRVIALPDLRAAPGTRLPSSNLIYTWHWGDQLLSEQSGIGRSILNVTAPVRYRDAELSVTVTNQDQTLVAEASALVSPADPIVRIYPADPLQGPDFDHALTSAYSLSGEEAAFRGVAYFFGTAPSLTWSVNSKPASSDREVTVRTTGAGQGTASLSLAALNSETDQTASARVPVIFGKTSKNIFGF